VSFNRPLQEPCPQCGGIQLDMGRGRVRCLKHEGEPPRFVPRDRANGEPAKNGAPTRTRAASKNGAATRTRAASKNGAPAKARAVAKNGSVKPAKRRTPAAKKA
jgi:hypothetical protein